MHLERAIEASTDVIEIVWNLFQRAAPAPTDEELKQALSGVMDDGTIDPTGFDLFTCNATRPKGQFGSLRFIDRRAQALKNGHPRRSAVRAARGAFHAGA